MIFINLLKRVFIFLGFLLFFFLISLFFPNYVVANANTDKLYSNSNINNKGQLLKFLYQDKYITHTGCSLENVQVSLDCNLSLKGAGDLSKDTKKEKEKEKKKENTQKKGRVILNRGYIPNSTKFKKANYTGKPIKMNKDEKYWLLKLVEAESADEPLEGKIAVATTIANRVLNSSFPNSVYAVIKANNGKFHQYSPWDDGSIYKRTPSKDTIFAVEEVFERGYRNLPADAVYFYAPKYSPTNWISQTRKPITKIGSHVFSSQFAK